MLQDSKNVEYSGTHELITIERCLVQYNLDVLRQLISGFRPEWDVLDFGAGIGTLADLYHRNVGTRPDCVEIASDLRGVVQRRGFVCYETLGEIRKRFDGIYTSNVLEHIADDEEILKELSAHLKTGGTLAIYVPAGQFLFNDIDRAVGHYRRYGKVELLAKLTRAGFEVLEWRYVDSIGALSWLFVKLIGYKKSGTLGSDRSLRIFDKYLYPVSRIIDRLGVRYVVGKNLLVTAKKAMSSP
jgi:SAM-dependent methyltransferase